MKTGGGDFSPEAYQQLRDAYSKEQDAASNIELAGKEVMGLRLGLETLPVDSPWADKIENWKYPDGKSEYKDGKQSPDEILEIMRQSAVDRIEAKSEEKEESLDEMSDEEFDAHIDKVLSDVEEEEEEEEEEETEEDSTEEEPDDESDDSDEVVEAVEESETGEESEEEDLNADELASQISELRSELEALSFVPNEPEEETVSDDESE
jgi:hypothetical protein